MEPGPESGQQQQQAALAFVQAQRVGASGVVWNHGRGFKPEPWFALYYVRQFDSVSGCGLTISAASGWSWGGR